MLSWGIFAVFANWGGNLLRKFCKFFQLHMVTIFCLSINAFAVLPYSLWNSIRKQFYILYLTGCRPSKYKIPRNLVAQPAKSPSAPSI